MLMFIALQQPTCSTEKLLRIIARTVESSQIGESPGGPGGSCMLIRLGVGYRSGREINIGIPRWMNVFEEGQLKAARSSVTKIP